MIKGVDHELGFWKQFVKSDRFLKGWVPTTRTPELNDIAYKFFTERPDAKVLDCGSGVVSILHGTVKQENLMAADLLGDEYRDIFDYTRYGIEPPIAVGCEGLKFVEQFDIVHISNALDHCQQPDLAFWKLYQAVKPGGFLMVQGFVNEGTHENWSGFHNWNLDIDRDRLTITDKTKLSVTLSTKPYFSTKVHLEILGRDWLIWVNQKPTE